MESLKIVLICILAAIFYGILHDQFTARICVEYFTVFHPPVFRTQSPTLLALGWGVIATWWVGALLGIPLAIVARAGSRPKVSYRELLRPIAILLVFMAGCALVFGIVGFLWGPIPQELAVLLPASAHRRFVADWWAHSASYLSGLGGGLVLCVVTYKKRFG
ncbi:MAG TPA: hypothetical protein VEW69_12455 [Alphaproteobacteria bacterium]|nr:hypothetical protein [Alphaproteobacteria bacterium]